MPTIAENRKALFDYEVLEEYEAGLVLLGHEVKSARNGGMRLKGAYVTMHGGELWLIGSHIARYAKAGALEGYEPDRSRKLLVRKREIRSIAGKMEQKGLTLVPISVYASGSKLKMKFALARGRKMYEKREKLRKRDIDREVRRSLKSGLR